MTGLFEVRLVQHLAVERCNACAICESRDDFLCMLDIGGRRREGGVDWFDLIGMDCEHAGESFALRGTCGAFQAFRVAKIGMKRFDGIHAGGSGRDQGH